MGGSTRIVSTIRNVGILVLVFAGAWEASVRTGLIPALALPAPTAVLATVPGLLSDVGFLSNWGRTLAIWLAALSVGLVVGLMLGFLAGVWGAVDSTLTPILGFLRAIPPIALFPIALIAIGVGGTPIGTVAAIGAALYVFPGTTEAARQASAQYAALAVVLGANRWQFFIYFVAPGATLYAVMASRVAATYAFAVTIAGEMIIGGRSGVGAAILDLSERYHLEEAYAYVLCAGVVGVTIELMFGRISAIAAYTGIQTLDTS